MKIPALASLLLLFSFNTHAQERIMPSVEEIKASFSTNDVANFKNPPKIYYPETWFHFIGGNVSEEGIEADMEAISQAGISGIQWFHGHFGGPWPNTKEKVKALSPEWENMVAKVGQEASKHGLRMTVQTCPGWAMAGGPWIKPKQAMRDLVWSHTIVSGGNSTIHVPKPTVKEDWRDYQDICVLAFPTPEGDANEMLQPRDIHSAEDYDWAGCMDIKRPKGITLSEKTEHVVEFTLGPGSIIRTLVLPDVATMNHNWCYDPGITIRLEAYDALGKLVPLVCSQIPASNWQSKHDLELACNEVVNAQRYRMTIHNNHSAKISYIRFLSAAHKNAWGSEAGWSLLSKETGGEHPCQSTTTYVPLDKVIDITSHLDASSHLNWKVPAGESWTVLRIGHVNSGRKNSPAPPEATGWECNKLDPKGAESQFAGYVGHLVDGPLKNGMAQGMLMDSWECHTQTWTDNMERDFMNHNGYQLRPWLPAVMGYVIENQEKTSQFLLDWRRTLNDLYIDNFFKRMTDLAHAKGLEVQYETAGGDVLPIDIMEYFKHADVPMCEFWQPFSEGYVGDINFKPIYPTASAAHIYGKNRVAAESFTSFALTWDEHWQMLKEVANYNMMQGVTHNVFHTYTHNPQVGFLPPGTSFGSGIGTPFLRGQTWWKYMPYFTTYLARTSYLLERGIPVKDVLWYLGDEMVGKPDQKYPFPEGYSFDYCNPDVLLHRISVKDGLLQLPNGISYGMLWIPETERMLPETLKKVHELIQDGAHVLLGEKPSYPATLRGGSQAIRTFQQEVASLWNEKEKSGAYSFGKGLIAHGLTLEQTLHEFGMQPDVVMPESKVQWQHRRTDMADWYYVAAPVGKDFHAPLCFRSSGNAEWWNPVTGEVNKLTTRRDGEWQTVILDLCNAESGFVVFRHDGASSATPFWHPSGEHTQLLSNPWTLTFPQGWGAPEQIQVATLKPWKDLELGTEGKAFSGTATYTTTFNLQQLPSDTHMLLALGKVDMIADVFVNGQQVGVLWTEPYTLDIGPYVHQGDNILRIDVTGTWYNRLVYDAGQPEDKRKTWTINGPRKDLPLHATGLMGPVELKW